MLLDQCIQDTLPFLIFLLTWVNFFAILSLVMGIEFEHKEYSGVSEYIKLIITLLRNSIGDVNAP